MAIRKFAPAWLLLNGGEHAVWHAVKNLAIIRNVMVGEFDFVCTGPGTLAGDYLRRFWQPVYVSRHLASGQAVPIRIMGEDFTLYRGEAGQPHLLAHRCAHRLSQLSTGYVEGDTLRCSYHGWRYDHSGECVEQPAEPKPFCHRIRIDAYPTVERSGLVFGYFGSAPAPDPPAFPELEVTPPDGVAFAQGGVLGCNYFQAAENIVDDVHVAFAHRNTFVHEYVRKTIPRVTAVETSFGLTQVLHHPGRVDRIQFIMPNQSYLVVPVPGAAPRAARLRFWYVPVDDVSHRQYVVTVIIPAPDNVPTPSAEPDLQEVFEVLSGRKRFDEVKEVRIQDAISTLGQGAIVDRSKEHLGASDAAVILLRRIWRRELKRLADGEPLTPFRNPAPEELELANMYDCKTE